MSSITSFTGKYQFLSNFYPSPVHMYGKEYPTVEHAFHAAKSLDPNVREKIRQAPTPSSAKRLGRRVDLRPDWNLFRLEAMDRLIYRKFENPQLAQKLIDTAPSELIEGNAWGDRFWGAVYRDGEWQGTNMLGHILMEVRGNLIEEAF